MLERAGYLEALEAERTIEARGPDREPAGARRRRAGVPGAPRTSRRLSRFLQEISLYSDQDAIRGEEALVTLMTLHNAKGLEFRAVFMIGMEEGIFPHSRSIEEHGVEEERRLCVRRHDAREGAADADARDVALALRHRARTTCPSRFLDELPVERVERERLRPASWSGYGAQGARRPPREDVPSLSTGDSVRHGTLGEGVVTRIEPGGVVTVRFADDGASAG